MTAVIPGILESTLENLQAKLQLVEPYTDVVHIDITHPNFFQQRTRPAPQKTIGLSELQQLNTRLSYRLHLMVSLDEQMTQDFCHTAAQGLIVYPHASINIRETLETIRSYDKQVGLALEPEVGAYEIEPFLDLVDYFLVMGVESGQKGQPFLPQVLPKIEALRQAVGNIPIGVDGGIEVGIAKAVAERGADFIVVNSALFSAPSIEQALAALEQDVLLSSEDNN